MHFETKTTKASKKIILIMHIKDLFDHHIIGHITWLRRCLSDLSTLKLFFYPFSVFYSLEGSFFFFFFLGIIDNSSSLIFSFKTVFCHEK